MSTESAVELTASELLVLLAKRLGVESPELLGLLGDSDNFGLLDLGGRILRTLGDAAKESAVRQMVRVDYDQTLVDVLAAANFEDKWVNVDLGFVPPVPLGGQQSLEVIELRLGQKIRSIKLMDVLRERGLVFADALISIAYAQQYAERWEGGIATMFITADGLPGSIIFVEVEGRKRILVSYDHNEVFDEQYTFLVLKQGIVV